MNYPIQSFACDDHGTPDSLKQKAISPWVIAHRGASGYKPEHTLAAYGLAISQGATFIEPDLVPTKDGILVARHENEISGTTNVAEVFPDRKTTKIIEGDTIEGWFTEDFTLAEIKQLLAKERLPFRSHTSDFKYTIPTLQEIINIVHDYSDLTGIVITIVPEIKHSTYFNQLGFKVEDLLLSVLEENKLLTKDSPVYIQSFEVENLKYLRSKCELPLLQLIGNPFEVPYDLRIKGRNVTFADMLTEEGLKEIATYANMIGPPKELVLFTATEENNKPYSELIQNAHAANLKVIVFTLRNEEVFIPAVFNKDPLKEYLYFFNLGIDGLFTDFPDVAIEQRNLYLKSLQK
jgi:glycerophosphoryl diester phosphodiesterase